MNTVKQNKKITPTNHRSHTLFYCRMLRVKLYVDSQQPKNYDNLPLHSLHLLCFPNRRFREVNNTTRQPIDVERLNSRVQFTTEVRL